MIRQDSGTWNALGAVKIDMPNSHAVYMHDTNNKNAFDAQYRFLSHGCTRVQNVRELVNWLLMETPNWGRADIDGIIKSGDRKDARVAKPVPLYWVYVTAWATPDGVVQFREDNYNRDAGGPAASASTRRG